MRRDFDRRRTGACPSTRVEIMSRVPSSADRASRRDRPRASNSRGFFTTEVHGDPHSRGTETVGERDPKDDSTAILPLKHASDLSTFRREHILAKSSVLHCLWRKVQIARAGYFESRVAEPLHDFQTPLAGNLNRVSPTPLACRAYTTHDFPTPHAGDLNFSAKAMDRQ